MSNKKCLVFETMGNIQNMEIIKESSNTNEIRLHGVFGVAGIKNNNNRIYSKENYGMMVENLQNVIANEGCLGELEHPNSMNIDLNNVSHKIESIEMNEDGTVTGTILILNTDKGKNAKAIVEAGVPLYISSRAAGNIDEAGNVTLTMLKTYDLVGTPGFSQAKLNLVEGQKFESLNENLCVIFEGDDLLGGSDDDDDKKEDDKSDDSSDDSKKEDDKKEEEKTEEDDKKEDEKSDEDNKNNNDNETTMNDLKKSIDELSERIKSLEADLHVAQESLQSVKPINYDAIQNWVSEEFAPEFKSEIMDQVENNINDSVNTLTETIAEGVQNWVCEEFAPEVQNWVCEEFAPEVQNWVCEEFAPTVEGWINEEFAPTIENWVNEEFAPEHAAAIEAKVNENVNAFLESQKNTNLDNIDAMLEALDNDQSAIKAIKEQQANDKFNSVWAIANMPAEYRPSWETLNETRKEEIARNSRAYDFTKEGVLESFWSNVEFTNAKPINENKDITSDYHNSIMERMMALRH